MVAYQQAILSAKEQNIWKPHPNFKRKNQVISLVEGMGMYWNSDTPENDVPINTCVVWDKQFDNYFVFITTDIKSTKLNMILFHIVCVLFGYLFYQLYILLPEGEKYLGKSLPVILKNYMPQVQPYVVLYTGYEFGVLTLFELMEFYAHSPKNVQKLFENILK